MSEVLGGFEDNGSSGDQEPDKFKTVHHGYIL
jgi:hypothetical protein